MENTLRILAKGIVIIITNKIDAMTKKYHS